MRSEKGAEWTNEAIALAEDATATIEGDADAIRRLRRAVRRGRGGGQRISAYAMIEVDPLLRLWTIW